MPAEPARPGVRRETAGNRARVKGNGWYVLTLRLPSEKSQRGETLSDKAGQDTRLGDTGQRKPGPRRRGPCVLQRRQALAAVHRSDQRRGWRCSAGRTGARARVAAPGVAKGCREPSSSPAQLASAAVSRWHRQPPGPSSAPARPPSFQALLLSTLHTPPFAAPSSPPVPRLLRLPPARSHSPPCPPPPRSLRVGP